MRKYGFGQSQPRSEDIRFLRGVGNYTDDFTFPAQAHLYVVRSPHAAARIRSIDLAGPKHIPGCWPCSPARMRWPMVSVRFRAA